MLFDGRDVTRLPPTERNIAQVFQFPVIYDTMTVYDNLAFPLRNRGVPPAAVDARVRTIAEMLELDRLLGRRAAGLTADGKQKISMGRGLVREDVNVIMFDEPLTVIDPHLKWKLRSKLKELHQRVGATMIYVTHDQTEALTFADQVVVMQEGEVVQVGTPGRPLRAAGPHLRRPLHRLARHEHPALRDPRRRRALRRPPRRHRQPRHRLGPAGDRRPPRVRLARAGRHPGRDHPRRRRRPQQLVEARAADCRVNALLPEDATVAPGPTHLAFAPAQTRIYIDGWLAAEEK